jgi:hypothetical protein
MDNVQNCDSYKNNILYIIKKIEDHEQILIKLCAGIITVTRPLSYTS